MSGGILVVAEHLRGEIAEITYEMLGIGRKIADALNIPCHSALLGKEIAPLASHLGMADSVLLLEHPQGSPPSPEMAASLLRALAERKQVSLVLIGGTNVSLGIGPKLSARSRLPFVNFCKDLRVENGTVVVTSQLFGGKILADLLLPGNRGIVSICPGSFPPDAGKSERTPPVEAIEIPVEAPKATFKRYLEPEAGDVDITRQEILVAVGRGIQHADNLPLAEELARAMGGAVCASRPVIDQGWLPLTRQVGKSGMVVKPKLYLALGVSGAPEHQEGMKNAPLVIAVNTDPKAPIFDVSHYGVCGDLFEIVPRLIEAIQARKGGK
ncbi:MAG: electron transfer flavoprotein subunit alpha/FixB family protein [Candidatus Tectomicrobia bacterium]|uniref:Electron transfer flavoprotein subunit alpha/FixB family protein n=1 Tax=Tectimicrobiota bacterium TaxID=2528274 RepID=A0A932CPJ1_UNCTE|nr:electron transfer flavoprotein subunit alpha/FixB family protein [Candidatus Tectomicrobia bacterium]